MNTGSGVKVITFLFAITLVAIVKAADATPKMASAMDGTAADILSTLINAVNDAIIAVNTVNSMATAAIFEAHIKTNEAYIAIDEAIAVFMDDTASTAALYDAVDETDAAVDAVIDTTDVVDATACTAANAAANAINAANAANAAAIVATNEASVAALCDAANAAYAAANVAKKIATTSKNMAALADKVITLAYEIADRMHYKAIALSNPSTTQSGVSVED